MHNNVEDKLVVLYVPGGYAAVNMVTVVQPMLTVELDARVNAELQMLRMIMSIMLVATDQLVLGLFYDKNKVISMWLCV